ncbi:MAG: O-antigen ligase family protein [Ruminococcaceae bacterium]|nr:O-antigen ligase family protein [Oscillospiraceae bacterium]
MENRQRKKSVFDRFLIWLLTVLQRSFIGRFFTSYDKANDRFERIVKETRHTNGKGFASFVEKNRLINCVPKIVQFLMRVPLRDYGIMMFMSGAVVTVLYPINDMILFINVTFDMFVLGAAICVASIPLLFSSRSLAANVLTSKLFCSILFDFLGMDREGFRVAAEKGKVNFATFSFLIGASLGVASYFVLPTNTLLIILALVLAYSTLRTPEVGVVVSILLLPFIHIGITCICVAYTFVCYMIKVSLGKRIFKFEYFDLWISATILIITVTGINYKNPLSSLGDVAINLTIMLSYFLFANLIYSKEYFRRSVVAFTTSSLIVSIIAIIQAIMGKVAESFDVLQKVFPLNSEIAATFESSKVLAHFIVVAIPFALVHMISEKSDATKFGGFLMSALFIVALVLTESPAGLLGLIVGVLLIFVFFKKRAIYLLFFVLIAVPVLYFALPDSVINEIFSWGSLSSISIPGEFIYIKDNFLNVIKYPFGINIAGVSMVDAFGKSYIDSLPLQILAKYGIVGALMFLALAIMFVRVTLSYSVKAKNEYRRVNGCAGLCSILALLSVGAFANVWIDKKIFLLFVTITALSFAYIKIEREEELVLVNYIDISSASVDVPLKEAAKRKVPTRTSYVHVPKAKKSTKNQEKFAEAKEFTNTQELFAIKRKFIDKEEKEEE